MNSPTPREAFKAGLILGLSIAGILLFALYVSLP